MRGSARWATSEDTRRLCLVRMTNATEFSRPGQKSPAGRCVQRIVPSPGWLPSARIPLPPPLVAPGIRRTTLHPEIKLPPQFGDASVNLIGDMVSASLHPRLETESLRALRDLPPAVGTQLSPARRARRLDTPVSRNLPLPFLCELKRQKPAQHVRICPIKRDSRLEQWRRASNVRGCLIRCVQHRD